VASTRSDPGGAGALERLASGLLALMAAGAVTCVLVGLGLRWLGSANGAERWLSAATTVIVAAPLVSLVGVASSASRGRGRVAIFAWGALLVTLLGMGLAR
jgi:hypothetical protein